MNVILDLVGSTFIGGTILLLVLQLNSSMNGSLTGKTVNYNTQSNLTSIMKTMEKDFRKTGFGVSTGPRITVANSNKITILYDKNSDGVIDSISYYLGPTSELSYTANPRDRILYRRENNKQPSKNLGVTQFKIEYFDNAGNLTTTIANISYFKVSLNVESPFEYENTYSGAYWENIIKPKNL